MRDSDFRVYNDRRLAGVSRYVLGLPRDARMRVPATVKYSTFFLGTEEGGDVVFGGTGFFVVVPHSSEPGQHHFYAVTANHNIIACRGKKTFIRFNDAAHPFPILRQVNITGAPWFGHPSVTTDVAVLPFTFDCGHFSLGVPSAMFLHEGINEVRVGEGDEVFIAGLFTPLRGTHQNFAIVRTGNVAMMPSEKIPNVNLGGGQRADIAGYLIEARSTGGLSGSPVFVHETVAFNLKPSQLHNHPRPHDENVLMGVAGPIYFLGMAQGHWEIYPENQNETEIEARPRSPKSVNLGIAIVIPARLIAETINQKELLKMRKKAEEKRAVKSGTSVPDSGLADSDSPVAKPVKIPGKDFDEALSNVLPKKKRRGKK